MAGALEVIREELPKWWNHPQQKDFRDTLGMLVPQSPAELGATVMMGPLGKMAKVAGGALAASTYSPDAEAVFLNTNHLSKAYESLLKHLTKGTPQDELWRTVGKETGYPSSVLPWKNYPGAFSEISDTPAQLLTKNIHSSGLFNGPLGQIFNHPELFGILPKVANARTTVNIDPNLNKFTGWFKPYGNRIHVQGPDTSGLKDVLSHEVNHLVNEKTMLPLGSSPKEVRQLLAAGGPKELLALAKSIAPGGDLSKLTSADINALYLMTAGEQLSTQTQKRLHLPQSLRIDNPPSLGKRVWIPEDSFQVSAP
jgi:hypothetical protein